MGAGNKRRVVRLRIFAVSVDCTSFEFDIYLNEMPMQRHKNNKPAVIEEINVPRVVKK